MTTRKVRIHLDGPIAGLDHHLNFDALIELEPIRRKLAAARARTEKDGKPADEYMTTITRALEILNSAKEYSYIECVLLCDDATDSVADEALRNSVFGFAAAGWVRVVVPRYVGNWVIEAVKELQRAAEPELGLDVAEYDLPSLKWWDYAGSDEDRIFDVPDRLVKSVETLPIGR